MWDLPWWLRVVPGLAIALMLMIMAEIVMAYIPIGTFVPYFPPLVPQLIVALVLGIIGFVVSDEVGPRLMLVVVALLLAFMLLPVQKAAQATMREQYSAVFCSQVLIKSPPHEQAQIELPDDFQAVPEVEFHWTGDLTCRWPGGSSPTDPTRAIHDARIWDLIASSFSMSFR